MEDKRELEEGLKVNESLRNRLEEQELGTHMCCIYRDKDEQLSALSSFMSIGIERNEKCLYIVDDRTKTEVIEAFEKLGFDVEEFVGSNQFEFLTKNESYLKDGYFDPDEMIELIDKAQKRALEEGYDGLRLTGEMTWVFSDVPGVEKLMGYEAKLNEFLPEQEVIAMCQYNKDKFTPETLVDVLNTHPEVLIYDDLHENPFYMPPKVFKAQQEGKVTREHYENMKENIIQRTRLRREEKKTRKRLEKEKEKAQKYLDIADVIIVVINTDHEVEEINQRGSEILGYDKEEIVGKNWFENFLPERLREEVIEDSFKTLEEGDVEEKKRYENPILTKDGEERVISWKNTVLRNDDGEIIGTLSSGMDVTERKKTEEELRESEGRYRGLFESVKAAIVVHGPEGEIISTNPAAEEAFGLKEEELKEKSLDDWEGVLHKENGREMDIDEFPISKVYDSKELVGEHVIGIPPEGTDEIKWYIITAVPQFNEKGKIERVIVSFKDITERKRAEERFRKMFDESPVGIWEEDFSRVKEKIDGLKDRGIDDIDEYLDDNPDFIRELMTDVDIISVNDAVLEMYKAESIEEFEDGLSKIFGEKSIPSFKKLVNQIAKGETEFQTDKVDKRLNGEEVHIFLKWSVSPGYEDTYERVIVTTIDITDRKEMEEELRESEGKFRNYVENALNGVFVVDKEGNYLEVNKAACEMTGYSEEELLEMNISDLCASKAQRKSEKNFEELLETGEMKVELPYLRKDGSEGYWIINAVKISDDRFLGFTQDITERKKAEERFKKLFNASPDPTYLIDKKGVFQEVNDVAVELLGYEREEIIGKHLLEAPFFPLETKEKIIEKFEKRLDGEDFSPYRIKAETKNGEHLLAEINAAVIEEEGELVGTIGIARDITELKKSEERRDFLNTLLRQDLRSKHQTLQGYFQLLEDEADLPEKHREYLEKSMKAGREADEILNLAKKLEEIDDSRWTTEKDIINVLRHVIDDISSLVENEGVQIEENYHEEIGKVKGDYSLKTLFSQILVTRIQSSTSDTIKIGVKEREDDILLSIEDNGKRLTKGIKNLFSGDVYTGKTAGAGGVRYYMIREVAEHNNCSVEVKDSDMGGARFDVRLKKVS